MHDSAPPSRSKAAWMPPLVAAYVAVGSLLAGVVYVSEEYDVPVSHLTRDPTDVLQANPFVGVVSSVGVLFWCAAAAICFFAALQLRRGERTGVSFLAASGCMTLWLLLDDLFLLHEKLLPKYLYLAEPVVYAIYLAMMALYVWRFWRVIVAAEYPLFLAAGGFFALSIAADLWLPPVGLEFVLEDGCKLAGIVTWFLFLARTALAKVP